MKKSVKIRVFSLIIASMLLVSALTVAAVLGSPYETLKKAVLDAVTYRNATVETHAVITVNGEVYEEDKSYYTNGDNSYLRYYFDEDGNPENYFYSSKNLDISRDITGTDGTQWYRACVKLDDNYNYNYYNNYYQNGISMFTPEDRDSASMRFMEMFVDLMVGDLKNNVTMSSDNGIRHIQGTLTESQVPDIIKAGIDVLIEQTGDNYYDWRGYVVDGQYIHEEIRINGGMKSVTKYKQPVRPMTAEEAKAWDNGTYDYNNNYYGIQWLDGIYYIGTSSMELVEEYTAPATSDDFDETRDPLSLPIKNLTINYVHGEAEVDSDGNLLYAGVNATLTVVNIFGDTNVIEVNGSVRFSDIGISEAVCPIPGAEELLTLDYMKNKLGNEYGSYGSINVYFTLNEDGSINADSVTTTYPGETERFNNLFDYVDDEEI